MTPELYQRLKPLFEAALERPPSERLQFAQEACRNDDELRQGLEALLAASDDRSGTLDAPLVSLKDHFFKRQRSFSDGDLIMGRFQIVRLLGFGGMGEVYEAEDRLLQGVHVALKTILPDIAGDPELRKRFEKEVLLAQEVTHPNLCPIHTIFHCEDPPPGFLFLTMKLLPGQTLALRLREPVAMSIEEKLAVLRQTALGLAAIHAAGIIHRDIKSNNIMIDTGGSGLRLWITDFGLARAYETETTISGKLTIAGTPGYIAPELYLGHPPSQASDLFAFGVVMHEVITGEKPTLAPDSSSYLVSRELKSPPVPAFCVELVTECLQNDQKRRCAAFERALDEVDPKHARERRGPVFWTRRRFLTTAAASAGVVASGAWWKWDDIENLLYPLPKRRFVALLNWPKTSDAHVTPMLTGVLAAIKSELARVEAFDRDFFVVSPEDVSEDIADGAHLKEICDPLGANLVLAASVLPQSQHFQLRLRVLDPISGRPLRQKTLTSTQDGVTSLPGKAVQAAATLLDIGQYLQRKEAVGPGTQSTDAFTAFQSAEALMNQPNDSGLDAAIEKYKQAIELDPNYAIAHANLAEAYARLYVIRRDPGALDLARANGERAVNLDPDLVEGYQALGSVLWQSGNNQAALDQYAKALKIDPTNPMTLRWRADVYFRMNRWADAEEAYRRVLQERPNSWVTYNNLATTLHAEGKYREAIEAYRDATTAAPGSALAWSGLGAEYLQIGDFARAMESLKKSLEVNPNFDGASTYTSLALRYQGKYEEALPFALKAVELNPADDTNWLELGDCYSSMPNRANDAKGAYLRAAEEAERHLQTDTSAGASWMLLALYEVKTGKPSNALSLIRKAESLGADDLDSQFYKVRTLELLGRREEALAALAACFHRGGTPLQIAPFPDMQSLTRDPRYREMITAKTAAAELGQL